MKNIKILSTILFGLALLGCDPLEDEIKEVNDNFAFVQDLEITLTDDDYEIADDACDCSGFGNFSSEDDAKVGIVAVLNENYPGLGKNSSAIVTYDIYNGSTPDLRGEYTQVTVPTEDYAELGNFYPNFGNPDSDVVEWVNWKGYEGEDGDYIDVTFDYYDGSFHGGEVSRIVYTVAYGWQYAWILPQEVYDFFGESSTEYPDGSGNYTPDFSYDDEASEKLHIYLNNLYDPTLFAVDGDILAVQYNYDNGADNEVENPTEQDLLLYIFSNGGWVLYSDEFQVTQNTLSFGHDGTTWVPDNTIKYSLTNDDYQAIGAATATSNPAGSTSASTYGNFDIALWTSEQIFDAIANRLLDVPGIIKEDGQKYLVTYATWEPGAGTGTIHFIYSAADSAFIEFTE